jgi:arabinan endo-1,5-alpha-L-arabinosidase
MWGKFASRRGEARYPGLWDGRVVGYCPSVTGPTGTRLHDLQAGRYQGTLTNMDPPTDWVRSSGQYALDFDGSNDYVLVPHNSGLDRETNGTLTISVWVRRSANVAGYETLVTKRLSVGTNTNYELSFNNTSTSGSKAFTFYSGGPFTLSTVLVPLLSWTHIATVSTASGTSYYANGQPAGTSITTVGSPNLHPLKIAAVAGSPETSYFNGQIDDVAIYNRALTAGEIRTLSRRRGIAYEARRQDFGEAGFKPYWSQQRTQLIGGGL